MSKRVTDAMVGMLIVVVMISMMCACSYVESHYTRKDCVVVEVEQRLVTENLLTLSHRNCDIFHI